MIGNLAQAILAYNPDVLKALRSTYSHVFLDEFQDTMRPQYTLTKLAFGGSSAVLTAVGDTKQSIMTWAGAVPEIFSWFERRFQARREMLQINHRSNKRIVQIINDLVTEIEPDAVPTSCARPDDQVPVEAAAFWIFSTAESEAQWLANFIAEDIAANAEESRGPDDFALLVRVRADKAERQLKDAFTARGVRLRNEARRIKGIAIQDLMSDELVLLLLKLIRIALGIRGHEIYGPVQETLGSLLGADYENPPDVRRLENAIRSVVRVVKELTAVPPAAADMNALANNLVRELGESALRRIFRQYDDYAFFCDVQAALAAMMAEHAPAAEDWKQLVQAVEGIGQVRLMTIHKSKGLEFHTVIFVGLHQNAFFGYRNNQAEETNAFFVALSRARERVFFTRSEEGGGTDQIRGLIELLEKANVPAIELTK
jgi:superfamily I DNA/RNA helicase